MALLTAVDPGWDGEQDLDLTAIPTAPESVIDVVAGAVYTIQNVDSTATALFREQAAQPDANARARKLFPGGVLEWQAPPDTDAATVRGWFWTTDPDGCALIVS